MLLVKKTGGGKSWARTWMVIRTVAGIVFWGVVYAIQKDYGSFIFNTGVLLAIVLLLTGNSNRIKITGSIALTIITAITGFLYSAFGTAMNIPSTPERVTIPDSFLTYTNEGYFSIRYPSDWTLFMENIDKAEANIKEYLTDSGMGEQAKEIQVVFLGGKNTASGNVLFVSVSAEPGTLWPLETLVENTNQLSLETIDQYVEISRVKTTVKGRKAIIQLSQRKDEGYPLSGYTTAYVAGDKFLWTAICECDIDEFETYQTTFDQIVRSLQVEQ